MTKDSNPTANIERRRYQRLQKKFTMSYRLAEEDFQPACDSKAEILDIGGGGIRFLAPRRLEKNTQLFINLPLRDWGKNKKEWLAIFTETKQKELTVIGTVMWTAASAQYDNSYETGVRFIGRIADS